jgi:hypothetical protein
MIRRQRGRIHNTNNNAHLLDAATRLADRAWSSRTRARATIDLHHTRIIHTTHFQTQLPRAPVDSSNQTVSRALRASLVDPLMSDPLRNRNRLSACARVTRTHTHTRTQHACSGARQRDADGAAGTGDTAAAAVSLAVGVPGALDTPPDVGDDVALVLEAPEPSAIRCARRCTPHVTQSIRARVRNVLTIAAVRTGLKVGCEMNDCAGAGADVTGVVRLADRGTGALLSGTASTQITRRHTKQHVTSHLTLYVAADPRAQRHHRHHQ